MDIIHIKDLEIWANHGVFPEENALGQKFVVCADLFTNVRRAGLEDALEHSIDYGAVSKRIKRFMEENTCMLIESVAEKLAACLLQEYPIRKVRLEIKKPWAPVGLPLDTVSVEIERGWHRSFIALGSNMGNSRANLDFAVRELSSTPGCRVKQVSHYMVTKPFGVTDQPDFLNGVLEMDTLLDPHELLYLLNSIEAEAGRERIIHWGPRTLDLDILFYDKKLIETEDLIIPHVDLENRYFVLKPLAEIAPNFRHPILKKTVTQMLEAVKEEA